MVGVVDPAIAEVVVAKFARHVGAVPHEFENVRVRVVPAPDTVLIFPILSFAEPMNVPAERVGVPPPNIKCINLSMWKTVAVEEPMMNDEIPANGDMESIPNGVVVPSPTKPFASVLLAITKLPAKSGTNTTLVPVTELMESRSVPLVPLFPKSNLPREFNAEKVFVLEKAPLKVLDDVQVFVPPSVGRHTLAIE